MSCPSRRGGMSGAQRRVVGIMRDRSGIFMASGDITVHSPTPAGDTFGFTRYSCDAVSRLAASASSPVASCLLPAYRCLLPPARCWLPAARRQLPPALCPLPAARWCYLRLNRLEMHHPAFGLDRHMEVAEKTLPEQSCDLWRKFGYCRNHGLAVRGDPGDEAR